MTYHIRVEGGNICIYQDNDLVQIKEEDCNEFLQQVAASCMKIRNERKQDD